MPGQNKEEDASMDEDMQCGDIPIDFLKSNNKKERFIQ
jgi:hypothetical protein